MPTLVVEGEEPEGLCEKLYKWPIQTAVLLNTIREYLPDAYPVEEP